MLRIHNAITAATMAVVALIAGCAGTPTKQQPGVAVEDRSLGTQKPPVEQKPAIVVDAKPVVPAAAEPASPLAMDPALKDPKSPLSRRIIYFDFDRFEVKEEFRTVVAAHAKYIAANPKARMIIQGHTDERGSREYNLALGQRRSDAVKQMMTVLGAEGGRVESVSFGEEKPAVQGTGEAAYAQNRRAEIVYQGE